MKKPGKNDDRHPAKPSGAFELQALLVRHTTKRQQILHGTVRVLICAIALPAGSVQAIFMPLITKWM